MKMRLHHYIKDTTAEGFGHRFCIWTQGCSHHCDECMASDTWAYSGGTEIEPDELIWMIRKQCENGSGIEGVTFLGGEPFEQAEACAMIAQKVQEMGLSVIAFTGYTYEQLLQKKNENVWNFLENVDLLIDGPYQKEKRNFSRPLVGSENQRFLFLSDRYHQSDLMELHNGLEIQIKKDGTVKINGMADFENLFHWLAEKTETENDSIYRKDTT